MKTVFSGIQPSGALHVGNYVGAIHNWVQMQDQYRCIYCVVDYHAITQDYEVKQMSARVREMALDILALGVDPEKAILFVQSAVPEHTELAWIFGAVTGHGDLERMTQFKDKSASQPDNVNAGLFFYPVLQAADILLYKAELVPVGADQVQHLELARRVARSFNHRWGKVFPECEAKLTATPKVLGLDGKAKMSKSLGNHIPLTSIEDRPLRKLLGRMVTDEKRVTREDPGDPDVCNVFSFHKIFSTADDQAWVRQGCTTAGIGCVDCKGRLAERMVDHFAGYRERRAELLAHPGRVDEILAAGAEKARAIAQRTLAEVRQKLGLWRSR
ncbi:MAG: tryptophan--tRNA ligase [Kofleriaceae bacterium]|nr:tryptophan--tRNA ligase [Kofleriaceae bacterium]MCL4228975.1 tryptophan--tRNA ligase [Myxococcales bacterium]